MSKRNIIFNILPTAQSGGISRYCSELYKHIIINNKFDIKPFPSEIKKNFYNFNFRKIPYAYLIRQKYINYKFKNFLKNNNETDLYHETNFIFNEYKKKKVLTVHDLAWIHYPDFHPKERVNFMEKRFENSLNKADAIITCSKFVKKDLIKVFNISPAKIQPIYLASSSCFKKKISKSSIDQFLLKKKLIHKNFFLLVSTIEPRKNIINTIAAYKNLITKKEKPLLVIVGALGWKFEKIKDEIDNAKGVIHLQNISDSELNILMISQKACIFNSFYEGFGLPIVESMKFSKPIITSNNSSMKEIAKNYSILTDPTDIDEITLYMKKLVEDQEFYSFMCKKSETGSKKFSWSKTADQTQRVYKKVLNLK